MDVSHLCLLCGSEAESRDHLFFSCSFSSIVWKSFFSHHSIRPPVSFQDIVTWIRSGSLRDNNRVICKLLLQAVVYSLWKERNSRLHDAPPRTYQVLIKEIQLIMRAKLAGLDRQRLSLVPLMASVVLIVTFILGSRVSISSFSLPDLVYLISDVFCILFLFLSFSFVLQMVSHLGR